MNSAWPTFSFTDILRPPDGWETDHAIIGTYSADLVVMVTALLALAGYDLDDERKGSRVELVKTIEVLSGRVSILAQTGRVIIPGIARPILKLLDKFVRTINADETINSWHPKIALIRFRSRDDATDTQWRVWVGSRNLTRALNWDAGLIVASRADGKGERIEGLAALGEALATRAQLSALPATAVATELAALTWECPKGAQVHAIGLLGPGLAAGFPQGLSEVDRALVISPFLDPDIIRAAAAWGHAKTRRTLVSTPIELQRLKNGDDAVFAGFSDLKIQPLPDLPGECADTLADANSAAAEPAESEDIAVSGLHAKLFFAAKGARRRLWLGSANATNRGWDGRNFEIVAELSVGRDIAEALEEFVAICEGFTPGKAAADIDADEDALETARKALSARWNLRQKIAGNEVEIIASSPPPLADASVKLEVAVLGGGWNEWPTQANHVLLSGYQPWQRSDFLQLRISRGTRVCSWIQIAPCDPPPDDERDRGLIAQYLDPRTFLLWLRSLLMDEPAYAGGGAWDVDAPARWSRDNGSQRDPFHGFMPTVEEILRSWARDRSAFNVADQKVTHYLGELERRAEESGAIADAELLRRFQKTWEALALELR